MLDVSDQETVGLSLELAGGKNPSALDRKERPHGRYAKRNEINRRQ